MVENKRLLKKKRKETTMNNEPTYIDIFGSKTWLNSEGLIHRDGDLPAVIHPKGHCEWWRNGELYRNHNLPAVIWSNGLCHWYQNGDFIKAKQCTPEEIEQYKKPYGGKQNE